MLEEVAVVWATALLSFHQRYFWRCWPALVLLFDNSHEVLRHVVGLLGRPVIPFKVLCDVHSSTKGKKVKTWWNLRHLCSSSFVWLIYNCFKRLSLSWYFLRSEKSTISFSSHFWKSVAKMKARLKKSFIVLSDKTRIKQSAVKKV